MVMQDGVMRRAAMTIAAAAAAVGAAAQQPTRTLQQDFDAATTLSQGTDKAAALAAWDALLARATKSARTAAIVQGRRASVLEQLGRNEEAAVAAEAALARMPTADPTLREDRYLTLLTRARVRRATLDYAGAATDFAAAEALADQPAMRLGALNGLVEVQTFVDPAAAKIALDRTDALIASSKLDPASQALFARRRAVLAMNTGDLATAQAESQRAVKLLGGLTSQSSIDDVAARGDAALALILAGQAERAREYLAYTGQGRLPNTTFDPARNMVVPDCGGEAALKPADLAVVEFTIGDDGAVTSAAPIYAAGGPTVGLEFARAAAGWSWTPEQVKELPRFYRYNVRVEMRCSTGFERQAVTTLLDDDLSAWLETKGLSVPDAPTNAATAAPAQRAALAAAEARDGRDSVKLLVPLLLLQNNPVVGREETHDLAVRSLAIARAAGAPPRALLGLAIMERMSGATVGSQRAVGRALESLLTDPTFAADAQSRAAVRLLLADRRDGQAGAAILRQVAADPQLKADDPAKVGALVRLASREQSGGNPAAAKIAFEQAGIAPGQCALLDAPPTMTGNSGRFPEEARRWGFEGWTQTQFDVDADGRVANERAILSYPAFVFTRAGTDLLRTARFTKSYRPDGKLGCGSLTKRVRFTMGP